MPVLNLSTFDRNGAAPSDLTNEVLRRIRLLGLDCSYTEPDTWEIDTAGKLYLSAPKANQRFRLGKVSKTAPCHHAVIIVGVIVHDFLDAALGLGRQTAWHKRLTNDRIPCSCVEDWTYAEILEAARLGDVLTQGVQVVPAFRPDDPDPLPEPVPIPESPPEPAPVQFDPAPDGPILGWRAYELRLDALSILETGGLLAGGAGHQWMGNIFTAVCGLSGMHCRLGARLDGLDDPYARAKPTPPPAPVMPIGTPDWLFNRAPRLDLPIPLPPPTPPPNPHRTPDGLTPEQICEWHLSHCEDSKSADSCGVYMFGSLPDLWDQSYLHLPRSRGTDHTGPSILAQCAAYGVVVPFEQGVRASRVRIETLWLPVLQPTVTRGHEIIARILTEFYSAPCYPITEPALMAMIDNHRPVS